jgi:hypothetical protein
VIRPLLVVAALCAVAHAGIDLDVVQRAAPSCDPARAHCFGIQLHVAADDAALVAPPDWIAEQLGNANLHFATIDVGFRLVGVDTLSASAFHIAGTRPERSGSTSATPRHRHRRVHHRQARHTTRPARRAYGVTWHIKDGQSILVSNAAMPRTPRTARPLLRLPQRYAISIMNKKKRDEPSPEQRTFAAQEVTAMRQTLKQLLRDKIIKDVKP